MLSYGQSQMNPFSQPNLKAYERTQYCHLKKTEKHWFYKSIITVTVDATKWKVR